MSMEKITKEELKNLFDSKALSDDELEMVAGGNIPNPGYESCVEQAGGDWRELEECKNYRVAMQ